MKHWTTRQAVARSVIAPDTINDELAVSQSSITTLDRSQMPPDWCNASRLEDYALHRVYQDPLYPLSRGGEQTADQDTSVPNNSWISSTIQVHLGDWTNIGPAVPLPGFKGGSLYMEYGCNSYANNIFADGINDGRPGSPAYVRLRILVNGITLAERRGKASHGRCRVFGSLQLPAGDLTVNLQFKLTEASEDAALVTLAGGHLMQAHIYAGRYLAIGRWR